MNIHINSEMDKIKNSVEHGFHRFLFCMGWDEKMSN